MTGLQTLQQRIDTANVGYYNTGTSAVDDATYDRWIKELTQLNPGDERLQQVGAPVHRSSILTRANHTIPMGSLTKAQNKEEFFDWVNRRGLSNVLLHAELKLDGGSFSFRYHKGKLVQVISRGDGLVGEDITANAMKFKYLPRQLKEPRNLVVRGEVVLAIADWKILDPESESNPRNLAVGIARRKSGDQSEYLTAYMFGVYDEDGSALCATESVREKFLIDLGFQAMPGFTGKVSDIWGRFESIQSTRSSIPFWIDGVVVKVEDITAQLALGSSDNRPKGQVAIKFEAEGAETILRSVRLQVGHTGVIVPVAVFDPVTLGSATIANANLCNWDNIAALDVAIGDQIRVIKAGDIIPRVISATPSINRVKIPEPAVCPVCAGAVKRKQNVGGDETAGIFCINSSCPAQVTGKIEKYLTGLDILGAGEGIVEALVSAGYVADVADLYDLYLQPEEVADLTMSGKTRIGNTRADKFIAAIEAKRNLTIGDFLGALGIPGLGKRRVQLIQEAVPGELDSIQQWLDDTLLKVADRANIPNLAQTIYDGIQVQKPTIYKCLTRKVNILPYQREVKTTGTVVCITGSLSKPKEHFKKLLLAKGYQYAELFNKEVGILVAADPNSGSTKLTKALKNGVKIISEQQLEQLLG